MTDKSIWRLRHVLGEIEDLYKTTKQDACNHFVDINNTIEMPENEDKGIIIDGIDVSKCEYCLKMTKYRCSIQRDVYKCLCEENPNCYYKQLKRKEKECEKYKQTLTEIKEFAKNMNNECFYSDFDCKDCDMKNGCTYFNKKQILQKINECEVENDNA